MSASSQTRVVFQSSTVETNRCTTPSRPRRVAGRTQVQLLSARSKHSGRSERWGLFTSLVSLPGCDSVQSVLHPQGPQARNIYHVWNLFLGVAVIVWVLVAVAMLYAIGRRRAATNTTGAIKPPEEPDAAADRTRGRVVGALVGLTVATLFGLVVASVSTGRAIASLHTQSPIFRIVGHQWWWEIKYSNPDPSKTFITANEIHIPVGRPVEIELESRDVIHSLWIPELHGKRDLIPGHMAHLVIQADQPGTYRGQCAEFCGYQHAHMAIEVIAEREHDFQTWLSHQRAPARRPVSDQEKRGLNVFLTRSCVLCHNIQGTLAAATNGPDLTHVASRRTLAAGTLPNLHGQLAAWILDPQGAKPGTYMPANALSNEELGPLLTYLETLQ